MSTENQIVDESDYEEYQDDGGALINGDILKKTTLTTFLVSTLAASFNAASVVTNPFAGLLYSGVVGVGATAGAAAGFVAGGAAGFIGGSLIGLALGAFAKEGKVDVWLPVICAMPLTFIGMWGGLFIGVGDGASLTSQFISNHLHHQNAKSAHVQVISHDEQKKIVKNEFYRGDFKSYQPMI